MGYFLSFLLGGLLAIGGYLYFVPRKWLPPKSVDPKAITQNIPAVDRLIQRNFSELGLSKEDLIFQQSTEKTEGNVVWKQTVIKTQCPRSLSFSVIEASFRNRLTALGKPFSIQSTQDSESLHLDIRILDRMTHELTFIPIQPTPAPKGLPLKTSLPPRIAIVIDDLGEKGQISKELLDWNLPITFSILPFTRHAKSLASEAHQKGKEIILHLPMEPHGYPRTKPGKGALLHEMDQERLRRQLLEDIEAVPHIQGVSNHMGSRLMEDPEALKVILSELKKRDLFFLDSRTTPQTVGFQTAKSMGLRVGERNVFLDHTLGEEAVKQSIEKLIHLSLSTGQAIGIGHPHASTLKSLKEMIPRIEEKGIEIVPVSALLE